MDKHFNLANIVKGCGNRNSQSQAMLYRHYYGYGMSVALRYSSGQTEAEEILNDAFLNVFKNIDQYDIDYPFKAWLRKIVIHKAIDSYRRSKKYKEVHISMNADDIPPVPDDTAVEKDDDILSVIQLLSPAYRTVFNLYVMDGYKHHQIAEMLQISVSASKSNLSRAKRKIKKILLSRNKYNTLKAKGYGRFL